MKKNFKEIIKKFDMYGQPIRFWYKGSLVFATSYGVCVSISICILLLVYSILLVIDLLSAKKALMIEVTKANEKAPKYSLISDYTSYFNQSSFFPVFNMFSNSNSLFQMSIGFEKIKTNEIIDYDPSYITLNIRQTDKKKNITDNRLFYDYCKRFLTVNEFSFKFFKLDKSLCIYSDIITEDYKNGEDYKSVYLNINVCKNDTWTYETLEENNDYQLMERRYKSLYNIKTITDINQGIKNNTNITIDDQNNSNIKSDRILNINDKTPRIIELNKSKNKDAIICKSKNEIINFIKNTRVVIYFTNSNYNMTNKNDPIYYFLDNKKYPLSSYVTTSASLFYKNDIFNSFDSLIPYTLVGDPERFYYFNLEKEVIKYGDFLYGESDYLLLINILSSKLSLVSSRTYPNIFNLLGILGGISKIIFIVGAVITVYYTSFKLQESLVNDLYTVIDPYKIDGLKLDFKEYIALRKDKQHPKNEMLENILKDDIINSILNEEDQDNKNKLEKKYEIIYEAYKFQAYGGMKFSLYELIVCTFCKCFLSKKLKEKNETFKKSIEKLDNDTDFLSIIKALQEFENIKKYFLDSAQLNIFDSFRNKEIIADDLNMEDIINNHDEYEKNSKILSEMLDGFIYENKYYNDTDKKLLSQLINNKEEIVNKFFPEQNNKKSDNLKIKENSNEIKDLSKSSSDDMNVLITHIVRAFKK